MHALKKGKKKVPVYVLFAHTVDARFTLNKKMIKFVVNLICLYNIVIIKINKIYSYRMFPVIDVSIVPVVPYDSDQTKEYPYSGTQTLKKKSYL